MYIFLLLVKDYCLKATCPSNLMCIDYPQNDTHLCVCKEGTANSDKLGISDCSSEFLLFFSFEYNSTYNNRIFNIASFLYTVKLILKGHHRQRLLLFYGKNCSQITCVKFYKNIIYLYTVKAGCGDDITVDAAQATGITFASPGR